MSAAIESRSVEGSGVRRRVASELSQSQVRSARQPEMRSRRVLPDIGQRDWMTAEETALAIGCSVATIHRLRRGLIPGLTRLPAVRVGSRKFIFRKESVARWQDAAEKDALAA